MACEPVSAGLHNHFRVGKKSYHPLGAVLFPTVQGMIGINHFAGLSLIDADSALTENTFVLATKGSVDLFAQWLKTTYDFWELAPNLNLAQRGFNVDKKATTKTG